MFLIRIAIIGYYNVVKNIAINFSILDLLSVCHFVVVYAFLYCCLLSVLCPGWQITGFILLAIFLFSFSDGVEVLMAITVITLYLQFKNRHVNATYQPQERWWRTVECIIVLVMMILMWTNTHIDSQICPFIYEEDVVSRINMPLGSFILIMVNLMIYLLMLYGYENSFGNAIRNLLRKLKEKR